MSESGLFKENYLTAVEHMDADKHWIGETLPAPTQTEIAATVGTTSGPGDSPFPARADHTHKIDAGLFPVSGTFQPGGTLTATSDAVNFQNWATVASITVPAWAIAGVVQLNISGLYCVTAAPTVYQLDVTFSSTAYTGVAATLNIPAINERIGISLNKNVVTSAGSRTLLLGARRAAGTGFATLDPTSRVGYVIWWRP